MVVRVRRPRPRARRSPRSRSCSTTCPSPSGRRRSGTGRRTPRPRPGRPRRRSARRARARAGRAPRSRGQRRPSGVRASGRPASGIGSPETGKFAIAFRVSLPKSSPGAVSLTRPSLLPAFLRPRARRASRAGRPGARGCGAGSARSATSRAPSRDTRSAGTRRGSGAGGRQRGPLVLPHSQDIRPVPSASISASADRPRRMSPARVTSRSSTSAATFSPRMRAMALFAAIAASPKPIVISVIFPS